MVVIHAWVIMSNHLHDNPVKAGIVDEPEHYRFSSAIDYCGEKGILDIELIQ